MLQKKRFRNFAAGMAVAAALAVGAMPLYGQATASPSNASQSQAQQHPKPSITPAANDTDTTQWSNAQLIPLTVAQAWHLSGRNEAKFFDIVQQLAAISAQNRGLTLPDTAAAGQKAGKYIKKMAKADHQQLLYEIVDKAVQKVGTPASGSSSAD